MRLGTVLLALLFATFALAGTVWIGRYNTGLTAEEPANEQQTKPSESESECPEISESGPYPEAVLDETEYDFGFSEVGEEGTHQFVIHNKGKAPLKLKLMNTTCQCTVGKLKDDQLPPGESTEIQLTWTPKSPTPEFRHSARFCTNDPENSKFDLSVQGRVEQSFVFTPSPPWQLGKIEESQPAEISGVLHSNIFEDFQVPEIQSSHELLSAKAVPLSTAELEELGAKQGYTIQATLKPGIPVGRFREELTVQTDAKEKEANEPVTLKIPIEGTRPGPITILGDNWDNNVMLLKLGRFQAEQGKKQRLSIFIREAEQELEFVDIETDPSFLKISLEPGPELSGKNRLYYLDVEVPPGSPELTRVRGNLAKVIIQTNHPVVETIKFRVQFISSQ